MAESTIIREFLVALGYKHDEAALKKLAGGVTSATKSVLVLGTVIEATAIAVATGVARFASNLEALYFASQRTGSGASSLKAFDLAARNFGASIEEAQGSVESLAAFLRNNPGGGNVIAGWLGSVGVSARDANGQLLTGTALMGQLGKMFQIMRANNQTFRANQIAGMLGISDRTMLAMSTPGFQEELARQEKRARAWDEVSAAAHRFMVRLEDLKLQFAQTMLGFEGPAMDALEGLMKRFATFLQLHGKEAVKELGQAFTWLIDKLGELLNWLNSNGADIQKRIHDLFAEVDKSYQVIKPALIWIKDKFVELDAATDGWSTKLIILLATLKAIGATGIITGIASLGAGLAKAATGLVVGGAAAEAGVWAVAGAAFGVAAWGAIGYGLGTLAYNLMPEKAQRAIGDTVGPVVDWFLNKKSQSAASLREFNAGEVYDAKPNRAALDERYAPVFDIDLDITVNGNDSPQAVGRYVASEAEEAVKRAATGLIREFATVLR